ECQVVFRTAVLATESVAQEHVEPGEGRMGRGLHEGLQRDDARQVHRQARAVHGLVVLGDDVHPLEENGLDRVLPAPQRQRVVAERPKIRVQDERGKPVLRHMSVQMRRSFTSESTPYFGSWPYFI